MSIRRAAQTILSFGLSVALLGQELPVKTGRVFVHTRGYGSSGLDSWVEDGVSNIFIQSEKKLYSLSNQKAKFKLLNKPPILDDWKGKLKFRRGEWWFLSTDQRLDLDKHPSVLYRYGATEKCWIKYHDFAYTAADFEFFNNGDIATFGIHDIRNGRRYIASITTADGSTSLLDEIPFRDFEEWFWNECLTTKNDSIVYAYFPTPGRIYSINQSSRTLTSYQTPWPELTHETINDKIRASNGEDCFISTIDHPGPEHCYFLSYLEPQVLLVYKTLDQEQQEHLALSTGSTPVVEHVKAAMLSPEGPKIVQEWPTPSQLQLENWYVDTNTGFLIPINKMKAVEEKANSGPVKAKAKPKNNPKV